MLFEITGEDESMQKMPAAVLDEIVLLEMVGDADLQ
jgi:hypothetical protein